MKNKIKTYIFIEPHITGGICTIEITEEQIIKFMKKHTKGKKIKMTDKQLVEQFIIYNWAVEKIDYPKVK